MRGKGLHVHPKIGLATQGRNPPPRACELNEIEEEEGAGLGKCGEEDEL